VPFIAFAIAKVIELGLVDGMIGCEC